MNTIVEEKFTAIGGEDRTFALNEKEFVVPASLDKFNSYRKKFKELATYCANIAVKEYIDVVHDFDSFMSCFPEIYDRNLDVLINKAIDIIVSDGVYTITAEVLKNTHTEVFHLAIDDYAVMEESVRLTVQANTQVTQGMQGLFGSLLGNKSELVQNLYGSFTDGIVEESSKLNNEQKEELYQRVKHHILFDRVHSDYWNVFLTLVYCLSNNGKDIWLPNVETNNEIDNVFSNITNPNFPQDKITDILVDIIIKEPYKFDTYKFIEEKYGLTENIKDIIEYFGFINYTEFVYKEEDFSEMKVAELPKSEEDKQLHANNIYNNENQSSDKKTEKKGLFSFVENLDGEKVKKGLTIGAGILAAGALMNGLGSGSSNQKSSLNTEKKDLLGSVNCVYGRKNSSGRTQYCVDCDINLRNKCSRY